MKAITTDNLSKTYPNGKKALSGVSFSLMPGEIFGFLGPNGAGKTTAVKLLTGMLTPTEGSCSVFEHDPSAQAEAVHAISGVVTEHAQMYDTLSGLQNLLFYAAVFGLTAADADERARELLHDMGLTDAADQKLGAYSTGMRQRLSLARAMLHSPKVLFLDEPTSGLDPESAKQVNDRIVRLSRECGTTVFLCTHQLRYAQEICTHYGLVDEGSLLATGTLSELRALAFAGLSAMVKADRIPAELNAVPSSGGFFDIAIASEDEIPSIVRRILDGGGELTHVSARYPSLEDIYFKLIERSASEGRDGA